VTRQPLVDHATSSFSASPDKKIGAGAEAHGRAAAGDPPPGPVHRRWVEGAVARSPPPRSQPGHRGHHRYVRAPPPASARIALASCCWCRAQLRFGFACLFVVAIGEGDIPAATAEDVDLAVAAARDAFSRGGGRHWSRAPGAVRAKFLRAIAAKVPTFVVITLKLLLLNLKLVRVMNSLKLLLDLKFAGVMKSR
jgi:hypothetical protein